MSLTLPATTGWSRFSVPHQHAFIVTVSGGSGGAAWSVFITDETQIRLTGDSQRYNPKLVVPPELVRDSDGILSTSVTVRNRGPWIYVNATNTAVRVDSFAHLMRTLGGLVWSGVAMQQAAKTQGGETTSASLNGRVVAITNQTAETTTLVIEQRASLSEVLVPRNTVEPHTLADAPRLEVPERSNDAAIPLPLGRFFPYLPADIYGNCNDARILGMVLAAGIRPGGSPSLEVARKGAEVQFAYAELVSGGLRVPAVGDASFTDTGAFVYIPENDRYSYYWEGVQLNGQSNIAFQDNVASWEGRAQYFKSSRAPYLYLPHLCNEVDDDGSTGLTDGKYAIDERPETYATLAYHSDTEDGGRWVIPASRVLGRVSQNSTEAGTAANDFEGEGQPVGFYAYALLCLVGTDPNITTGTVRLSVRFIEGHALYNTSGSVNLDLQAGRPQLAVFALPAGDAFGGTNGDDDGWAGTDFPWNFQSAGTGDGDQRPNWNRNTSPARAKTAQFRVQVTNRAGGSQRIGVLAVGIRVCYRMEWSRDAMNDIGQIVEEKVYKNLPKKTREKFEEANRRVARGKRLREVVVPERSPYIDRVFFVGNGYKDNGSGTYTGTAAATLVSPVSWIHYLLGHYAAQTVITGSSLGSASTARTALNTWANWAHRGAGTNTWTQTHVIKDQSGVEDAVAEIANAYLPSGSQVLKIDTQYGIHVWIPDSTTWTYWPDGTATPLHPIHMEDGPEGPAIEFSTSDESEIVNDLRIRYDYDIGAGRYLRVATCSEEGSDDGYGAEWAQTPTTSVDADDICAWSEGRYGKHKRTLDLPGVRDPDVATAMGLALLWRFYRPMPRVRLRTTLHAYSMQPWHVFRFSDDLEDVYGFLPHWWEAGTDWEDIYWRATRVEQPEGEGAVEIEAEWYPRSSQIADEISAGAGAAPEDPGTGTIGEL